MSMENLNDKNTTEIIENLQKTDSRFALATIVRTIGATSAKPGAKAIVDQDGQIINGFLGGGCIKRAVKIAAKDAIELGSPKFISVMPKKALIAKGINTGFNSDDGITYSQNGCPSEGSVDIFIEPQLPKPQLTILGNSPIATALQDLALKFHWSVNKNICSTSKSKGFFAIIIATQGSGDLDALRESLDNSADFIAFVGSKKKFGYLAKKLMDLGYLEDHIHRIKAPAGLDIGAISDDEISLSIIAELIQQKKRSITP